MATASEQQLVDRAVHGDHAALGELLQRHQLRLYNVVLRMVGHRDDAAEITQDALLKAVEHIRDYRRQTALSTWLIRIGMNLALSHLRKRRLRRTASLDSDPHHATTGWDDQSSPLREILADPREPDPLTRVENNETLEALRAALAQLDEQFRAVLVLRDIDLMDYQQIAEVLSIPVGTVKSRLFRARLALRQQLEANPTPYPHPQPPRLKTSSQEPTHG